MTARKLSVSGGRDGCGSDGRKAKALAAVVEHCGGAGSAYAGNAEGADFEQGIEGANAAGGIRTLDALLEVRTLGVSRVGATRTAAMLDDCRQRLGLPAIASAAVAPAGY